ncbi:MAG: hypothetical protein H7A37_06145 [Chlamydiales bacterium]|nr:hypothetical protein [Chlamydiia bacterium]MCP5507863.1 hypothetical protein [Chlamydiales bacterium]
MSPKQCSLAIDEANRPEQQEESHADLSNMLVRLVKNTQKYSSEKPVKVTGRVQVSF